ncbi:deoxyuridine 5'-triphosphate nucleotidohydrolase [Rhizobium sp. Leaf384]|uniref:dUTP diphosphatase n=1 Tax=unclassified Rhizobium TaxID=2613769 RepID=UPI0007130957|nr:MULTISPECIES: dUTP diphosphatase [unclassified Rhizobium]KQR78138.1 deoxyuridine 5'-triphosphate nucleotidohydrolase [Rhizobium sp. Leaf341]KQS81351.1 deoxyuridine 5'-triphosphate nucleotidohydrolase [Rhizobium sp. Leaf384]KQS87260.1 deoxyuridine 5'-triphosphate nucleotidohydrolase [Rhizobium sp. Leaf383]
MPDLSTPVLALIRLPHGAGLALPAYESPGAAGMDLRAAVSVDKALVIGPGERALVPTGFVFEIPDGFEGQVRPRSGLAFKNGVTCLNTPGTIDSDYRGEVKVLLINHGSEPFTVVRDMRIAQMVVAPVTQARVREATALSLTARRDGGFGSTGL